MTVRSGGIVATAQSYRLIGLIHLALAIVVNFLLGIGLIWISQTDGTVIDAYALAGGLLTEQRLLRDAPTIAALATTGTLLAGVVLIALAGGCAYLVHRSINRDRRGPAMVAAVFSGLNPLAVPLAVIALVVLWLEPRVGMSGDAVE